MTLTSPTASSVVEPALITLPNAPTFLGQKKLRKAVACCPNVARIAPQAAHRSTSRRDGPLPFWASAKFSPSSRGKKMPSAAFCAMNPPEIYCERREVFGRSFDARLMWVPRPVEMHSLATEKSPGDRQDNVRYKESGEKTDHPIA